VSQATAASTTRAPRLPGQTVVIFGGSSGIGLETAHQARAEGAEVILTGRDPDRLRRAAEDVGALRTAAFDVTDLDRLAEFFEELPESIDHVMVSGSGPYYAPLTEMDFSRVRDDLESHLFVPLQVARHCIGRVRPGGSLLLISGTGGRRPGVGLTIISTISVGFPALTRNIALELAPIRVNCIAPGFVDTPLSATLLGDELDARREQLRATLPIGRVVGPDDVAALAVHIMTNTALTGATYDVDGGQQIVPA
jgi:NAD(P)-dependent dehydrogenase (short-subunit alcohol dehydrogenase family)